MAGACEEKEEIQDRCRTDEDLFKAAGGQEMGIGCFHGWTERWGPLLMWCVPLDEIAKELMWGGGKVVIWKSFPLLSSIHNSISLKIVINYENFIWIVSYPTKRRDWVKCRLLTSVIPLFPEIGGRGELHGVAHGLLVKWVQVGPISSYDYRPVVSASACGAHLESHLGIG